ncbi:hypothetical protein DFP72DRAFT_595329 [Ephemerocybe angulata]|uniref:Secreted protein n=1 Tax=Ephemerocybe angulata TaxID=980116 RepID=A0A8H6IAR7_9AGAR|nr:hypothetical protein DFP72DRAFT_595329 [Tulosesus angulatus]
MMILWIWVRASFAGLSSKPLVCLQGARVSECGREGNLRQPEASSKETLTCTELKTTGQSSKKGRGGRDFLRERNALRGCRASAVSG